MTVKIDEPTHSITIELKGDAIQWPDAYTLLDAFGCAMLGSGFSWDKENQCVPTPRSIHELSN